MPLRKYRNEYQFYIQSFVIIDYFVIKETGIIFIKNSSFYVLNSLDIGIKGRFSKTPRHVTHYFSNKSGYCSFNEIQDPHPWCFLC